MKDIHAEITTRFVTQLEAGTVPWRRPWLSPMNLVSRKPYRGVNNLLLGCSSYKSPYWMTFHQALSLGGNVRKGEKGNMVVFYKFLDRKDANGAAVLREDGTPRTIPFLRYFTVFNLEQIEGIEAPEAVSSTAFDVDLARAQEIVTTAPICPTVLGARAAYSPSLDLIMMPARDRFPNPAEYYYVWGHEAVHATGHASRLARDGIIEPSRFGTDPYAKEELVAELGAAFIGQEAGLLSAMTFDNSAAYLASWIKRLNDDKTLLISASSQAQKAAQYLLGDDPADNQPADSSETSNEPALAA